MTGATKKKRGAAPKRKPQPKRKVRRISWFDRFLRTLPFSESEIQRGFTVLIGLGIIILLFALASWLGLFGVLHKQYADMAARAGFQVERVEVTGMQRVDQLKVYNIVLAEKDRSMPLVDVARIRSDLLDYGWIKDVRVSRRLPDMLIVDIEERQPAAVWKHEDTLSLVDRKGELLQNVSVDEAGQLPRIYGARANEQVAGLNVLLDEAPSLRPHVIGASWVGNRRWDIAFKSGETLALPEGEKAAREAILNFARMDGVHRMLGRDIIHFDFRDPNRAYLRKKKAAPPVPFEDKSGNAGNDGKSA